METTVNVALVVPCTEAEGPGRRFAVWTQGCAIRCPGCCNPSFLRHVPNDLRSAQELSDELERAHQHYGLEGLSLLGGEPTEQASALLPLVRHARALGLSVMLFTGHTLGELRARREPSVDALLAGCDLLVDGRYVESLRSTGRRYIGSDNQVLHFLTDRYSPQDAVFATPNTREIRLRWVDGTAVLEVNGFPLR